MDRKQNALIGLVTQSVESNDLKNVTNQLVESILSKGPLALKLAKMVINRGQDVDLDTALMLEKLAQTVLFASEEKHEGTQAFMEKRRPNYHEV
jgi:enoyl-CoA hydratase